MSDHQHRRPIKVDGRTPHHQGQPSTNTISSHDTANEAQHSLVGPQVRARRAASWRLPVLESCGRSDPWYYEPPTAGYKDAAAHLLGNGLTPAPNLLALRSMWKAGGRSRRAAHVVAERWKLVA